MTLLVEPGVTGSSAATFTARDVVTALYLGVLGRDPDPGGLAHYAAQLDAEPGILGRMASEFHLSQEHHDHVHQMPVIVDHSQYGEFKLLLKRLIAHAAPQGYIVDVGARGVERSNSYDLLRNFRWKGVLVEANPFLHDAIERDFADCDFTLVRCAVGVEEGMQPFYLGANDDVSSLVRDAAAGWGDLNGEIAVEVRRLSPILDEAGVPKQFEVLSLDIEGLDVAVLNDLVDTSEYRPAYVIIEASYDFTTRSLADVGASERVQDMYAIVEQTRSNLILSRR